MPPKGITRFRDCAHCGTTFPFINASKKTFCSPRCRNVSRIRPAVERFWEKVDKNGPVPLHRPELGSCWVWTASKNRKSWTKSEGYGRFNADGRYVDAHVFALELKIGRRLVKGELACHECDYPPCVRDSHLFKGDARSNMRDMISKGRQVSAEAKSAIMRIHAPRGDDHLFRRHPELIRRGEGHPMARLTEATVRYIRQRVELGIMQKDVAIEVGVSKMTVSRVVRRTLWGHVE